MYNGVMKSFHELMKVRVDAVIVIGRNNGKINQENSPPVPAPSIMLAFHPVPMVY